MPLLDIFSKSKSPVKQNQQTAKIIIDNRERSSLVPSTLASLGIKFEFAQLPVADYLIGNIAVERKTLADFISSMISKRLESQLREIKQYPSNLLIIEGNLCDTEFKNKNALRGFLLSITLRYKVPIIFSATPEETADYLALLAKKQSHIPSIRASKIPHSRDEQIQFILEGFPHIGPKTAKKLVKKFGSIKGIINASEEELKPILGKRASDFKKLIE
jgi:Fanconi anemia group M protein